MTITKYGVAQPPMLKIMTPMQHTMMVHVGGMITTAEAVAHHTKIVIGDGMILPIPMMKNPTPCMCLRVFQALNAHMKGTEISAWA